jgi:hypothetical protein
MSLHSWHAQLEAADAQYAPPEFLDFTGVCDPMLQMKITFLCLSKLPLELYLRTLV